RIIISCRPARKSNAPDQPAHAGRFSVSDQGFDAVVIGAGAGGLCAAARLAHAGLHTLVVDDKDRPGGRASTEEIDGYKETSARSPSNSAASSKRRFERLERRLISAHPNRRADF